MELSKMNGLIAVILLSVLQTGSCLDCEFGHEKSVWDQVNIINPKSCPTMIDDSDEIYCCVKDDRVHCCDAEEFFKNGFGVLLPIIIAVAVGFLVACCLCCLCCPCCMLYKRRHRGTVYGRVETTVMNVQPVAASQQPITAYPTQPTSMPMPGYSQPGAYPVYPPLAGQQPPPYSEAQAQALTHEIYMKQAPYNPNFQ